MKKDIEMMMTQGQNPPGTYKQEFDLTRQAIAIISEHIIEDSQPAYMEPMQSSLKGMQMSQPAQQGMGQLVSQSGLGGNQPTVNPIAQAGMEGGPGELGGSMGM